jgi:hypothetical protein
VLHGSLLTSGSRSAAGVANQDYFAYKGKLGRSCAGFPYNWFSVEPITVPWPYMGGGAIVLAPIAAACELHIILMLFFFIMVSFCAMPMPAGAVYFSQQATQPLAKTYAPATAYFAIVTIIMLAVALVSWARGSARPAA